MLHHDPKPIVITGPGGWVGSAFLGFLATDLGAGWTERIRLFGSVERVMTIGQDRINVRSLESIRPVDVEGALVVHLAYLTKEKVDDVGERAFFDANFRIDQLLLDACRGAHPHAVFVASSGAAAAAENGGDRHPYGVCKLLQEDRFLAWSRASHVPVLAGRIYNLAGPHINKLDSYAIASLLFQGLTTGTMRVQARTPVFRSYLHVYDLVRLVIAGSWSRTLPDRSIDLCGSEVLEMSDLARLIAAELELESSSILREPIDFGRVNKYLGDSCQTQSLALQQEFTLAPFAQQMRDTASFIRGIVGGPRGSGS